MGTTSPVDCTLKDSTIHSAADPTIARKAGNLAAKIDLQVKSIKWATSPLLNVEPIANQSNTAVWNSQLAYSDLIGFENPIITVEGIIDVEDSTPAEAAYTDNLPITLKILQKFIKSRHIFVLESIYDSTKSATPNAGYYRIHSLNSSEDATTVNVVIGTVSITSDVQTVEGRKMAYSMELIEVKI